MQEAIQYHIFKQVQDNPEITQRELAGKTGMSLGKVNYCLRALVDKGCVKAINFKNSRKKSAYLYKLTPQGLEEKARVTCRFLKRKQQEYEELKAEIEELEREAAELQEAGSEGWAISNEQWVVSGINAEAVWGQTPMALKIAAGSETFIEKVKRRLEKIRTQGPRLLSGPDHALNEDYSAYGELDNKLEWEF